MTTELEKVEHKSSFGNISIIIVLLAIICIRLFIAEPFVVSGESMAPTFASGEYLIVDQLSYKFHTPERGDVIVFKYPKDMTKFYIKRVIGLPGETVEVTDSHVKIFNTAHPEGFTLDESYIYYTRAGLNRVTLGEDEYFVLGDNRKSSSDSRVWGPLDEKLIVGKAYARLLPVNRFDFLPGDFDQKEIYYAEN